MDTRGGAADASGLLRYLRDLARARARPPAAAPGASASTGWPNCPATSTSRPTPGRATCCSACRSSR
ncbi:hypothetical protein [Actinomadura keratinilytica]|uniref:hypothetical protein n=1 Tax=Actinomadura keratinilytica TaxID=547461 RepID=UPI0036207DD8